MLRWRVGEMEIFDVCPYRASKRVKNLVVLEESRR